MLEARDLTKYYGNTRAVRAVSFTVRPGEVLGYLGANGAGKSTTVRMLTGLTEPSEGTILFNGRSIRNDLTGWQKRLGYVPEEAQLYGHLSGEAYLRLVGRLRSMPRAALEPRIEEFLRLFQLSDYRMDEMSSYSKGMRQKILLSAALLHNPEVLILDEPFSGLDANSALILRQFLSRLAAAGKTILFSSHVLEVVEKVCQNVLILHKGQVVAHESVERLRNTLREPSLEKVFAQLTASDDPQITAERILRLVVSVPGQEHSSDKSVPTDIASTVARHVVSAYPQEFQNTCGEELLESTVAEIEQAQKRRSSMSDVARIFIDFALRIPTEYLRESGHDLRYAWRALRSARGYSFVAILSLSLGICIATCALSQLNGMALRTIPSVREPEALVSVPTPVSWPAWQHVRQQSRSFAATMAYLAPVPFSVQGNERKSRIWGQLTSAGYFDVLRISPALGRLFTEQTLGGGDSHPAVVSFRFWRDSLDSDPGTIGRTLRINGATVTVIGVAPPGFLGASPVLFPADLWIPAQLAQNIAPEVQGNALTDRTRKMFFTVGRLRPEAVPTAAEAEINLLLQQTEPEKFENDRRVRGGRVQIAEGGRMLPLRKQDIPFFTSFLSVVAALVMLIACANVMNMMIARAVARRRETAIRLAVGAGRGRLVRQLVIEALVLSCLAGAIGFAASWWIMSLGSTVRMPFPMPVAFDLRPDLRVFAYCVGIAVAAGLSTGLIAAIRTVGGELLPALKQGTDLSGASNRWNLRQSLIVLQVAAALGLLIVVGVLSVGMRTTLGFEKGFDSRNLFMVSFDPGRDGLPPGQVESFFRNVMASVQQLPGVHSAAWTESVPVSMPGSTLEAWDPSSSAPSPIRAVPHVVGERYFETAGIPILDGRAFRSGDLAPDTNAVIVSAQFARRLWGSASAAGRMIAVREASMGAAKILPAGFDYRKSDLRLERYAVIGVVEDISEGLVVEKPRPAVYLPLRTSRYANPPVQGITLLVRTVPGVDMLPAIRESAARVDDRINAIDPQSMDERIDRFTAPMQAAAWTYTAVGVFSLILASVGLAGLTAYSVARRSRELGIRMALGARPGQVMTLVTRESAVLVAVGTVLGLAIAFFGTRLLSAMNATVGRVTGTNTTDPVVFLGAVVALAVVTVLACYIPARRCLRIDPASALRQE
jgi:predicted permease